MEVKNESRLDKSLWVEGRSRGVTLPWGQKEAVDRSMVDGAEEHHTSATAVLLVVRMAVLQTVQMEAVYLISAEGRYISFAG